MASAPKCSLFLPLNLSNQISKLFNSTHFKINCICNSSPHLFPGKGLSYPKMDVDFKQQFILVITIVCLPRCSLTQVGLAREALSLAAFLAVSFIQICSGWIYSGSRLKGVWLTREKFIFMDTGELQKISSTPKAYVKPLLVSHLLTSHCRHKIYDQPKW